MHVIQGEANGLWLKSRPEFQTVNE